MTTFIKDSKPSYSKPYKTNIFNNTDFHTVVLCIKTSCNYLPPKKISNPQI